MNNSVSENTDAQTLLNRIVLDYMKEQKRKRRYRWVLRIILTLLLITFLFLLFKTQHSVGVNLAKDHVGLVDLKGKIFEDDSANANNFVKGLTRAYQNKSMKALVIRIDSPGGSPVQADYMYEALRYYRAHFPQIKIYAVCVESCASAAYYVAAAADEIYANPSSIVGSIGVLYNGFGFVDAIQKLGITRRLQTSGKNKGFLDPFLPMEANQTQFLQTMLDEIHQQFIAKVKEGRGKRLLIDDETFSGLFWTGLQAKRRGLIDGFASSGQLARDIIKIDRVVDYTFKENAIERISKQLVGEFAQQLPKSLGLSQLFR